MGRILIVGGYGAFGARVAERLARERNLDIVIAGRSADNARAHATTLVSSALAHIDHAALDATSVTAADVQALAAAVLINASGPFQQQDYRLARACIAAGCHYIDLADARAFVTGINALDAEARAANVSVVSGASSVPGLSSAAVRYMSQDMQQLDEVEIGISPGNSFDPGLATAASIIGQAGKPFLVRSGGRQVTSYGWQGLHRHHFPEVGARWMSNVDVPDLDLLPLNYPELSTARFTAGLEVGAFHLGLWAASFLVRSGAVRDLGALAAPMLAAKRRLPAFGSDTGGMFVRVVGRDQDGTQRTHIWHLIARSGDGPHVPAMPSVILAKRLVVDEGPPAGARPCFGLFTLSDFVTEVSDLDITCSLERA
ncbi:MAG TPA: saccharopine dehydrogenase NADP-binding domain-containing protein [Hyphomicrobium sp.]